MDLPFWVVLKGNQQTTTICWSKKRHTQIIGPMTIPFNLELSGVWTMHRVAPAFACGTTTKKTGDGTGDQPLLKLGGVFFQGAMENRWLSCWRPCTSTSKPKHSPRPPRQRKKTCPLSKPGRLNWVGTGFYVSIKGGGERLAPP